MARAARTDILYKTTARTAAMASETWKQTYHHNVTSKEPLSIRLTQLEMECIAIRLQVFRLSW
jgi:hypothetical protein